MAVRSVVHWPDDRLRQPSVEIGAIDASVLALYHDLVDSMRAEHGLGMAAPQLGDPRRMFIVSAKLRGGKTNAAPLAFLNPEVVWTSGETRDEEEGCLSFPGIFVRVKRPTRVRLRALGLDGITRETRGRGLLARCLLHEHDHLVGRLLVDYGVDPGALP